jgi:hydrogenase nickel incorporation protein HypB
VPDCGCETSDPSSGNPRRGKTTGAPRPDAPTHAHQHLHADGTTHSHAHSHSHHTTSPATPRRPRRPDHSATTTTPPPSTLTPPPRPNDRLAERNRASSGQGIVAVTALVPPRARRRSLNGRCPRSPTVRPGGDQRRPGHRQRRRPPAPAGAPVAISPRQLCHSSRDCARARTAAPRHAAAWFIENVGNLVCPASKTSGDAAWSSPRSPRARTSRQVPARVPPRRLVVISRSTSPRPPLEPHHRPSTTCTASTTRPGHRTVSQDREGLDAWLDWLRALPEAAEG